MQVLQDVYPLCYGDVMLIPPGTSHRLIIHDPLIPYRRFVFWISREYCDNLCAASADYGYLIRKTIKEKNYITHNDDISFNMIHARLIRLLEEIHGKRFGRKAQISLCVSDLLLLVNRISYERDHPAEKGDETSLYDRLLSYIENHIDEDLSLNRLAEAFYVSKYHIAHLSKNHLGMSVHQYITKKRLSLCIQALPDCSNITNLYSACGFGDYSSFYRSFKKEYGISPNEYKKRQRNLTSLSP